MKRAIEAVSELVLISSTVRTIYHYIILGGKDERRKYMETYAFM